MSTDFRRNYCFDAFFKAYPNIVSIDDWVPFDKDGVEVAVEEEKLKTAEEEVNAEIAAVAYQQKRFYAYPSIGDQLDNLYKDVVAGKLDATGEFAKAIKGIKDTHPKP
tara:strand:+ start:472 stop:795 length:324 start_codon:yes stop_codon:yes gene_type:complete